MTGNSGTASVTDATFEVVCSVDTDDPAPLPSVPPSTPTAPTPSPSVLTRADDALRFAIGLGSLKLGAGGYLTGIDIAPDGTKVVRTDTHGAYKMKSDGTWEQLITAESMPVTTRPSSGVFGDSDLKF
jgi:hypothetical protein